MQIQKVQDTTLTEKKVKIPILRKLSSNGICLDLGKLSKEHRIGLIHNLSQDFISGIVGQV